MTSGIQMDQIKFHYEYSKKLRACFIGCGRHAYNNVLQTLRYSPVDLLAVCDLDIIKAQDCCRQFGAERYYSDYMEMLEKEKPDVVFIITTFMPDGRAAATEIARKALLMGIHVWMEKPTAAYPDEVEALIEASNKSGKYLVTGMKKVFTPTITKAKRIIETDEFGKASSIFLRYPEMMPPFEDHKDMTKMFHMLDHIYHFGAMLDYLMGPIDRMLYEWEPANGGSVTSFRFKSGSVGTLYLSAGMSPNCPLEHYEIVGAGANLIVDNSIRLTYHRRSNEPGYGRATNFIIPDHEAPLVWEPDFALGSLFNNHMCLGGYIQEVIYFCKCVLEDTPPALGNLEMSLRIAKLLEAYCITPPGQIHKFS